VKGMDERDAIRMDIFPDDNHREEGAPFGLVEGGGQNDRDLEGLEKRKVVCSKARQADR
jgi:hypothetical protein